MPPPCNVAGYVMYGVIYVVGGATEISRQYVDRSVTVLTRFTYLIITLIMRYIYVYTVFLIVM